MKRFLAFVYETYYPGGGWGDLYFTFNNLNELRTHIKIKPPLELENWEIIDLWNNTSQYEGIGTLDEEVLNTLKDLPSFTPLGEISKHQELYLRNKFSINTDGATTYEEFRERAWVAAAGCITFCWCDRIFNVYPDGRIAI